MISGVSAGLVLMPSGPWLHALGWGRSVLRENNRDGQTQGRMTYSSVSVLGSVHHHRKMTRQIFPPSPRHSIVGSCDTTFAHVARVLSVALPNRVLDKDCPPRHGAMSKPVRCDTGGYVCPKDATFCSPQSSKYETYEGGEETLTQTGVLRSYNQQRPLSLTLSDG